MLQYPGVIPADGMALRPGVFCYGRLVCEAFDACVLTLLQMYFKPACSLADVHLSTGAWHFVDDVCSWVLDLSEENRG